LRLKVKKAAVLILPKGIYSNLFINSNGRALAEIYAIISRKLKNKIKAGFNTEKLLTIIMSI
jgi:ribosomal protein S17E